MNNNKNVADPNDKYNDNIYYQTLDLLLPIDLKKKRVDRMKQNPTTYNEYLKSFYTGTYGDLPDVYELTQINLDLKNQLYHLKKMQNSENSLQKKVKDAIEFLTNLIADIQRVHKKAPPPDPTPVPAPLQETPVNVKPLPVSAPVIPPVYVPPMPAGRPQSAPMLPPGHRYLKKMGNPMTVKTVNCGGTQKAWYHHQQYCACTFAEFADLINDDIASGIDPRTRLIACIEARKYKRNTNHKGKGNASHEVEIGRINKLLQSIQDTIDQGKSLINYVVIVQTDFAHHQGTQFYWAEKQKPTYFKKGGKRKTRKASQKKRKQTRRSRA